MDLPSTQGRIMSSLKSVTTSDLQQEIARRQANVKPESIPEPDFHVVESSATKMVDEAGVEGFVSEEAITAYKNRVFETVMEALYGPSVHKWWKSLQE